MTAPLESARHRALAVPDSRAVHARSRTGCGRTSAVSPARRRHDQAQVIAQPFDLVMAHMVVTLASPKRGVPTQVKSGFNAASSDW
jgi:hypothetical protein